MPLTPEDVQNKEFTTVRLREGYDMVEVDEFLDEVETALSQLQRENEELREKLAAVTRGGGLVAAADTTGPQPQVEGPMPPPSAATALVPGGVSGSPTEAAAKVLALAQKTADELVADAKAEADQLLAEARERAEGIDSESSAKVTKIEQDARARAEAVEREAQQRHQQVVGRLEAEREHLEGQVENLKAFEREYRSRLKAYLESELRKLETSAGTPDGSSVAPVVTEEPPDEERPTEAMATSGAAATGGSLRSVASLLDDEQR
ncbi:MAG: DivIVA domain-containing protein [Jiangellaceae bacterium]|nr:DivIVA domain-containing protein [Jiangellaceae bacterium]